MKHTRRPAALAAGILALALLLGGCAPAAASLTSPSAAGRSPLDWPRPRQDGGQDWFDQWFGSWYGGSGLTQAQRMYGGAGRGHPGAGAAAGRLCARRRVADLALGGGALAAGLAPPPAGRRPGLV